MEPPGTNLLPEWRNAFLRALASTANVRAACRAGDVPRTTAYRLRNADPKFREEWDTAIQDAYDLLEEEAWRRAIDGISEPVIHQGRLCEVWIGPNGEISATEQDGYVKRPFTVLRYSDGLLTFLLKGGRPEKYRENLKHIVEGGDKPVQVEDASIRALLEKMDITSLKAFRELRDSIAGELDAKPGSDGPVGEAGHAGSNGTSNGNLNGFHK